MHYVRLTIATLAAAAGLFVFGATHASAVGQLKFESCVNGSGAPCARASGRFQGAISTAVSPDGRSVYVAATNDEVDVLNRAPNGQVTFAGCVTNDGSAGACADIPGSEKPLREPGSIVVSPDGGSVYVASRASNAVSVFNRAAGGQLTWAGCVSATGTDGACAPLPNEAIAGDLGRLAISPDGRSLYATAYGSNSVLAFNRAEGGQITYAGCVSANGTSGACGTVGPALTQPDAVAVSPDGKSVLVGGRTANSVVSFSRQAGGQISFASCVADTGAGCVDLPGEPITGAFGIAFSPDGASVYVASSGSDSLSVFAYGPTVGTLTFAGCASDSGTNGVCADLPGEPLKDARGVVVSGDGTSVYTASEGDAVAAFTRGSAGQITYAGCLGRTGYVAGCGPGGTELHSPTSVTLSPDDRSLYVASRLGSSLTYLGRKLAPETTIDDGPLEGSTIASDTAVFQFSSDQQGPTFECSIDGSAFAACPRPFGVGPLANGQHTFAVRAITGGDPDPTPASRTFTVAATRPADPADPVNPGDPAVEPVDATAPTVRFTRLPAGKVRRKAVSVEFEADEPNVAFSCSLDGEVPVACGSPQSYRVKRGKHTVAVTATDAAGNTGPAAVATFRVKRRARR